MYDRLVNEELAERRKVYHKIPAFIVTYRAIDWISTTYGDIDPVEAWDEAVETMKAIAEADYKRFAIESTCKDLPRKYLEFRDAEGKIHPRKPEEADRTTLMVLFNVLFMLILRQKDIQTSPYYDFCQWIVQYLRQFPDYEKLCKLVRPNEKNLEEEVGHELEPQDFLNAEGMPMPITEQDKTKENLNRAVMITMQCDSYFHKGIDIIYIRALWNDMLADKYLHLDTLLNGQSFPTLVCGVVGLLSETICVKCHYSDLASQMVVGDLDKGSIAKYIGMKCKGSTDLRKVAKFIRDRFGKSSKQSSDFDI